MTRPTGRSSSDNNFSVSRPNKETVAEIRAKLELSLDVGNMLPPSNAYPSRSPHSISQKSPSNPPSVRRPTIFPKFGTTSSLKGLLSPESTYPSSTSSFTSTSSRTRPRSTPPTSIESNSPESLFQNISATASYFQSRISNQDKPQGDPAEAISSVLSQEDQLQAPPSEDRRSWMVPSKFDWLLDLDLYIKAQMSSSGGTKLCRGCRQLAFRHDSDELEKGLRPGKFKNFVQTLDHMLWLRDSCAFCGILFQALCEEENDPLQSSHVKPHLPGHLKGATFAIWAESTFGFADRLVPDMGGSWPFGLSKDAHETAEDVWRNIHYGEKPQGPHDNGPDAIDLGFIASAAVIESTRLGLDASKPDARRDKFMTMGTNIAFMTALGRSITPKRLNCWIVGNITQGRITIRVCGRGNDKPVPQLRVLKTMTLLLHEDQAGAIRLWDYGRILDPYKIDLSVGKTWLDSCRQDPNHQSSCAKNGEGIRPEQRKFRLIDVLRKCIVDTNIDDHQYAALSYTWGDKSDKQPKLTRANKEKLLRNRGLLDTSIGVDDLIKDVMRITEAIGLNFLWVDSWCIVQDEGDDQQAQIGRMDLIYKNAEVTIVAADCDRNGRSKFKGLYKTSERCIKQIGKRVLRNPNVNVLVPIQVQQGLSNWDSRAWTFQEKLLSRRLLVFSEGHLVWHCRGCTAREDMTDEAAGSIGGSNLRSRMTHLTDGFSETLLPTSIFSATDHTIVRSRSFNHYVERVNQYTGRGLKDTYDIINAFAGLIPEMEKDFDWSFFHGLPEPALDLALLWQPQGQVTRRSRVIKGHSEQDDRLSLKFPSWSWAGWMALEDAESSEARVSYETPFDVRTNQHGWMVKKKNPAGGERMRPISLLYRTMTLKYGRKLDGDYNRLKAVGLISSMNRHDDSIPATWQAARSVRNDRLADERPKDLVTEEKLFDKAIFLEAMVATFKLGETEPLKTLSGGEDGRITLESESSWRSIMSGKKKMGRVRMHNQDFRLGDECEFIALSEAQFFGSEKRVDVEGYRLYNVLAVIRPYQENRHIVERVGLGKMYKVAFSRTSKWDWFCLI